MTKLILLLFIADYVSMKKYGRKLTKFVWRKMFFGPYPENSEKVTKLMLQGNIRDKNCSGKLLREIPDDKILDYVVKVYGSKDVSELMKYIYTLDTFLNAKIGDIVL